MLAQRGEDGAAERDERSNDRERGRSLTARDREREGEHRPEREERRDDTHRPERHRLVERVQARGSEDAGGEPEKERPPMEAGDCDYEPNSGAAGAVREY